MKPRIEHRDDFMVVGIQYVGKRGSDDFPRVWNSFLPRIGEVTNWVNTKITYGVSFDGDQPDELRYMACREVSDLEHVPDGMVGLTVPGGKFAVFTHIGPVDTLRETYDLIYGTWLKDAGLETDTNYDFEMYDRRFNSSESSQMEIWIPLR